MTTMTSQTTRRAISKTMRAPRRMFEAARRFASFCRDWKEAYLPAGEVRWER